MTERSPPAKRERTHDTALLAALNAAFSGFGMSNDLLVIGALWHIKGHFWGGRVMTELIGAQ
jgi:hypothetical protein